MTIRLLSFVSGFLAAQWEKTGWRRFCIDASDGIEGDLEMLGYLTAFKTNSASKELIRSRTPSSDEVKEFIFACRSEVERLGVLSAIISSTLNALRNQNSTTVPSSVGSFVPSETIVLKNVHYFFEWMPATNLDVHSSLFHSQLSVSKCLLGRAVSCDVGFLSHTAIDQLCHAWRGLCGHALLLMADLEQVAELLNIEEEDGRDFARKELERSLIDARNGGSSLVLSRDFRLPVWAQKRRHRRFLLNAIGKVTYMGQERTVLVVDVSKSGMAIDFADGFAEGKHIEIKLSTGRLFCGRIVWSAGSRAGFRFEQELSDGDYLFSSEDPDWV